MDRGDAMSMAARREPVFAGAVCDGLRFRDAIDTMIYAKPNSNGWCVAQQRITEPAFEYMFVREQGCAKGFLICGGPKTKTAGKSMRTVADRQRDGTTKR